jgi:hypothetical protein
MKGVHFVGQDRRHSYCHVTSPLFFCQDTVDFFPKEQLKVFETTFMPMMIQHHNRETSYIRCSKRI